MKNKKNEKMYMAGGYIDSRVFREELGEVHDWTIYDKATLDIYSVEAAANLNFTFEAFLGWVRVIEEAEDLKDIHEMIERFGEEKIAKMLEIYTETDELSFLAAFDDKEKAEKYLSDKRQEIEYFESNYEYAGHEKGLEIWELKQ